METKICDIINKVRKNKGLQSMETITADMSLRRDLELTSFDLAELTVRIEDEFDIDVFEDGLIEKVGEIYSKLSNV